MPSYTSIPNRWVSVQQGAGAVLTYTPQVSPAPLTVSVQGQNSVMGTLYIMISNPTTSPVSVQSIVVSFAAAGTASYEGYTLAPLMTNASNVQYGLDTNEWNYSTATIGNLVQATLTCNGEGLDAGDFIIFEIGSFPTVTSPDTALVVIDETTCSSATSTIQITTFPAGFYFNSLSVNAGSGIGPQPVAQVGSGDTVTLVWNSSVTTLPSFAIYQSSAQGQLGPYTPSTIGEWVSAPLYVDTVFTIVLSTQDEDGQPLSASLTACVAVQGPHLKLGSISVLGATNLLGGCSVPGLCVDNVTVQGNIEAQSANYQTLNVSQNLVVNQNLEIGGGLSCDSLQVNGPMQLNGPLTANGSVQLLQPPQQLPNTPGGANSYEVTTDGFLILSVTDTNPPGCQGSGTIDISVSGSQFVVNGGYSSDDQAFIGQTLTCPVRANAEFSYTIQISGQQPGFIAQFMPLGNGQANPV